MHCFGGLASDDFSFKEEEVKSRLELLDQDVIDIDLENQVIHGYIHGYVVKNRKNSEQILGRTATYFPLFEQKLTQAGLPSELKFLAVVESALNPQAISPVGAGGLWQFMPETGKEFGLSINANVDERMDPVKSTDAAIKYLSLLYEKYGDWALVLAAYNSGAGRVNYAIKRSKSRDFWKLKKYLPRETRNYVPAFIAAMYLFQFQSSYGLRPKATKIDLQIVDNVEVKSFISFFRIAQITGVSLSVIRQLNPGYRRDFIPENKAGNFVTLPARVCAKMRHYLIAIDNGEKVDFTAPAFLQKKEPKEVHYNYSIYLLSEGESLKEFAASIGYSVSQLMAWNETLSYFKNEHREVRVYRSNAWIEAQPKPIKMPDVEVLPRLEFGVF